MIYNLGMMSSTNLFPIILNVYFSENKKFWLGRMDPIANVSDIDSYIPWWLNCNKERYPYWFGQKEPRTLNFYEAIQRPDLYSMERFNFGE